MIKSIITANSLQMIRAHFILFFHTSARSVKLSPQKLKLSHQNLNQKYSRYECTRLKILVIFFPLIYVLKYFLWHLFSVKKSEELQWVFSIVTTIRVSVWQGSYYFLCSFILSHLLRLSVCWCICAYNRLKGNEANETYENVYFIYTPTCHLLCICVECVRICTFHPFLPFSMWTRSVLISFIYDAQNCEIEF